MSELLAGQARAGGQPVQEAARAGNGGAELRELGAAAPARYQFRQLFAEALQAKIDDDTTTRRDIADVCAVTTQNVSHWLNARSEPGAYAFNRLCVLFGAAWRNQFK